MRLHFSEIATNVTEVMEEKEETRETDVHSLNEYEMNTLEHDKSLYSNSSYDVIIMNNLDDLVDSPPYKENKNKSKFYFYIFFQYSVFQLLFLMYLNNQKCWFFMFIGFKNES